GVAWLKNGRRSEKVNRGALRNPGSTLHRRRRLLASSPAPIRRRRARAISETARRWRTWPRLPLVPARGASLSVSWRLTRRAGRAGARPKSRPTASDTAKTKARTVKSVLILTQKGRRSELDSAIIFTRILVPREARNRPQAPPQRARTT